MRVTIAAQAAVLLLHRDTDYFPRLTSIIVCPSGYIAPHQRQDGGIWSEEDDYLEGHTQRDLRALVLAWDDVRAGTRDPSDGRNLILHEFAHQLDFEDGATDGTPLLESGAQARSWAAVFEEELAALRRAADAGEATLLDPMGPRIRRSSSRWRRRRSSSVGPSSREGTPGYTRSCNAISGRTRLGGDRTMLYVSVPRDRHRMIAQCGVRVRATRRRPPVTPRGPRSGRMTRPVTNRP